MSSKMTPTKRRLEENIESDAENDVKRRCSEADRLTPPFFHHVNRSTELDMDPFTLLAPMSRVPTFPAKIYAILACKNFHDTVRWMEHGRAWKIIDSHDFERNILPSFFDHSNISSFIRQANGWGFRRITNGSDRDSYYNDCFLRGLPHLIKNMRRPRVAKKMQIDSEHEPDLAAISCLHPLGEPALTLDVLAILNCTLKNGPKARIPEPLSDIDMVTEEPHSSRDNALPSSGLCSNLSRSAVLASPSSEGPGTTSRPLAIESNVARSIRQESAEQSSVDAELIRNLVSLKRNPRKAPCASSLIKFEPSLSQFIFNPMQHRDQIQQNIKFQREQNQMQHHADLLQQQHESSCMNRTFLMQQQQSVVHRTLQQMMQSNHSRTMAEKELFTHVLATCNNTSDAGVMGRLIAGSHLHMPHEAPSTIFPSALSQQNANEKITLGHLRSYFDAMKTQAAVRSAIVDGRSADSHSLEKKPSNINMMQSASLSNSQPPSIRHVTMPHQNVSQDTPLNSSQSTSAQNLSAHHKNASREHSSACFEFFKNEVAARSAIHDCRSVSNQSLEWKPTTDLMQSIIMALALNNSQSSSTHQFSLPHQDVTQSDSRNLFDAMTFLATMRSMINDGRSSVNNSCGLSQNIFATFNSSQSTSAQNLRMQHKNVSRDHSRALFDALKNQLAERSAISDVRSVAYHSLETKPTTDIMQNRTAALFNSLQSPSTRHFNFPHQDVSQDHSRTYFDVMTNRAALGTSISDGRSVDGHSIDNQSASNMMKRLFSSRRSSS